MQFYAITREVWIGSAIYDMMKKLDNMPMSAPIPSNDPITSTDSPYMLQVAANSWQWIKREKAYLLTLA